MTCNSAPRAAVTDYGIGIFVGSNKPSAENYCPAQTTASEGDWLHLLAHAWTGQRGWAAGAAAILTLPYCKAGVFQATSAEVLPKSGCREDHHESRKNYLYRSLEAPTDA